MSIASPSRPKNIYEQIVEVQRVLAGPHPGYRPVHAKGLVCAGAFRASAEARSLCRAVHLMGQPVPTVIRFSNASGDPEIHDGLRNVRALSVKFQLPDGDGADILANSIEGFPARTPEEFLDFLRAQLPERDTGKPAPDRITRFVDSHAATKAFMDRLSKKPVPASYAQASYHAVHAFQFTGIGGTRRFGRYIWVPEVG